MGQVTNRIVRGRIHWKNTLQQLKLVGPRSLGVALLTAGFVGMVFTIQVRHAKHPSVVCLVCLRIYWVHSNVSSAPQFVREFAKLGLTRSVGGVLALALARELTPVVTSIILAGRVGSAFAAELGTMAVRNPAPPPHPASACQHVHSCLWVYLGVPSY